MKHIALAIVWILATVIIGFAFAIGTMMGIGWLKRKRTPSEKSGEVAITQPEKEVTA